MFCCGGPAEPCRVTSCPVVKWCGVVCCPMLHDGVVVWCSVLVPGCVVWCGVVWGGAMRCGVARRGLGWGAILLRAALQSRAAACQREQWTEQGAIEECCRLQCEAGGMLRAALRDAESCVAGVVLYGRVACHAGLSGHCLRTPCVTFRLVVVSLRGPGQLPVLPFAYFVGSLLSVGRCGRCSCWCRFRVRGGQWLVCWGCVLNVAGCAVCA